MKELTKKELDEKNICPYCKGEKKLYDGEHSQKCYDCDGTGTMVTFLRNEILSINHRFKSERKKYNELVDYIKSTSTCKTCGGDQFKTWGLLICKECGLPGNGNWPG